MPFCLGGQIEISDKGFSGEMLEDKVIGITRIHLEEDAAKLNHFANFSGVDYNKGGIPLMEIVSEPDMTSADEAYAYLTKLKQMMQYAEISNCDMEKGQLRCDVNISLKPTGRKEFGTKIELKNMNSFRAIHKAIEFEIERQTELLDDSVVLQQETRGWDDDRGETYLMRIKESADDYRYFPEPDLLPVVFTDKDIENFMNKVPESPDERRYRFIDDFGLTEYDAQVLTSEKTIADYFERGTKKTSTPKILANWIITDLLGYLAEKEITINDSIITSESLAEMVELINKKTISGKIAKKVFTEMSKSGKAPAVIVKEKGLVQVTDESAIEKFVDEAIENNPKQVAEYKSGKKAVLQYFVGQTMKLSRGKANPQAVVKFIKEKLD